MLEILRSEERLLWRLVVVSLVGHVVFFLMFVGLNIARPPYRRIMPLRTLRLYSVTKPETLATKVQQPPPVVQPKPEATPKPQATPEPKPTPKKVIEKPKDTPTPAPPKPKQAAKATPRPTAQPRATPATTPRPRSTPASTPRPAVQPVATPERPVPQPRPVAIEQIDLPDFYFQSALAKIESNFHVPRHLKNLPVTTRVEFTVLRDGTISNVRVIKSSGNGQLDEIAARTLEVTRTLGPLPDTIQRNYVNLSVTFDFSIAQ